MESVNGEDGSILIKLVCRMLIALDDQNLNRLGDMDRRALLIFPVKFIQNSLQFPDQFVELAHL